MRDVRGQGCSSAAHGEDAGASQRGARGPTTEPRPGGRCLHTEPGFSSGGDRDRGRWEGGGHTWDEEEEGWGVGGPSRPHGAKGRPWTLTEAQKAMSVPGHMPRAPSGLVRGSALWLTPQVPCSWGVHQSRLLTTSLTTARLSQSRVTAPRVPICPAGPEAGGREGHCLY